MKNILIIPLILLFSNVFGQEESTNKFLFDGEKLSLSTFYVEVAPATAWDNLEDVFGQSFLIETGIHINRKFVFGIYSAKSKKSNQFPVPAAGTPEYQEWIDNGVALGQLPPGSTVAFLNFVHSGLNLGYLYHADHTVFFRANFKLGVGKLEITHLQKRFYHFFNTPIYSIKFVNYNPEIGVGVNLRPWWRLFTDVGYRFVVDNNDKIKDPSSLQGLTFKFGFGFGAFNR